MALSGVSLTNHVGYSTGSNLGSAVIQNSARSALVLSTLAAMDWMPKAEAKGIKASEVKVRNELIISLPCIIACLATGAMMPVCIAFCAILP